MCMYIYVYVGMMYINFVCLYVYVHVHSHGCVADGLVAMVAFDIISVPGSGYVTSQHISYPNNGLGTCSC